MATTCSRSYAMFGTQCTHNKQFYICRKQGKADWKHNLFFRIRCLVLATSARMLAPRYDSTCRTHTQTPTDPQAQATTKNSAASNSFPLSLNFLSLVVSDFEESDVPVADPRRIEIAIAGTMPGAQLSVSKTSCTMQALPPLALAQRPGRTVPADTTMVRETHKKRTTH